jgi:hypothetical protein
VKSKQRVADHGEVFTPPELVEAMLDLVKDETERIDSRFLEPACGSGNFLVPVLRRKLAAVDRRYGKKEFERQHYALLALMSIYGIELLADNVAECRQNLLDVVTAHLGLAPDADCYRAAAHVLAVNIVHGDALSMRTRGSRSRPIAFAEWAYLGNGTYYRRDFRLDTLTQNAAMREEDTLFGSLGEDDIDPGKHEIFTPIKDHGRLTIADLAAGGTRGD